jgi:glutathione peroxidase
MIYDLTVSTYDHKDVSLKAYKGKVLFIVNTAPKCGLVGQYDAIEALQKEFKDKDFVVLDFPCNQFLNQASASNDEIQSFCEINYQTTFTTFAKIEVNGKGAHPLYRYLKKEQPYDMNSDARYKKFASLFLGSSIKWNFTKFLVDKKGKVRYRFSPTVKPEDMKPYITLLINE